MKSPANLEHDMSPELAAICNSAAGLSAEAAATHTLYLQLWKGGMSQSEARTEARRRIKAARK
jgi:hypothetical protein